MALRTAITDATTGELRRPPHGWGWWHVECMTTAARAHHPEVAHHGLLEVWSLPATSGGLTIEFPMGFKDPDDGEVFILNVGDRLDVWRDR